MTTTHFSVLLFVLCAPLVPLYAWQDEVHVNFRNPMSQFDSSTTSFGFLRGASSEVRLARYLSGSANHGWRGGVDGDVALMQFNDRALLQFGLNIETLVDGQNDIHFRLVQVYYQALTGVKIKLGPGVLHAGIRHRCNHGSDNAAASRIMIRLGPTVSYHWLMHAGATRFDVMSGANIYVVGQNRDHDAQALGGMFMSGAVTWPIRAPFFMRVSAGTNLELVGHHDGDVYLITDSVSAVRLAPLFAGKISLRVEEQPVVVDVGLHFSQILDTGIGERAARAHVFSFDVDFFW